jgi:hypothetical protein
MKKILQKVFGSLKAKHLEEAFNGKDCCVQRVLGPTEALKTQIAADIVVTGRKAKSMQSAVWKELIKEAGLKDNVMILPPAKL